MTDTPHDEAQEVDAPADPVETQIEETGSSPAPSPEQEEESSGSGDEATEESGTETAKPEKTWYPYITRNQFEKFVSRLQGRIPDQIDRDYVRAIIRTPSMIYRFLRGIEAMQLIDRNQHPTERLRSLADQESRRQAFSEILQDLYSELLDQWRQADGTMPDREIASFFQQQTGMGGDSANKMKMFFKFLLSEADLVEPGPESQSPTPVESARPPEPVQERKASREKSGSGQRNGPQPSSSQSAPSAQADRSAPGSKGLSELQKAYIETIQKIVKINIDGDWDDDMIKLAFDRLERLFDRIKRG